MCQSDIFFYLSVKVTVNLYVCITVGLFLENVSVICPTISDSCNYSNLSIMVVCGAVAQGTNYFMASFYYGRRRKP